MMTECIVCVFVVLAIFIICIQCADYWLLCRKLISALTAHLLYWTLINAISLVFITIVTMTKKI